jgi:hypothetical protein
MVNRSKHTLTGGTIQTAGGSFKRRHVLKPLQGCKVVASFLIVKSYASPRTLQVVRWWLWEGSHVIARKRTTSHEAALDPHEA